LATKPTPLWSLQQQRLGTKVTVKAVGPLEEGLRVVTVKRGDVETKTAYKPGEKPRVISVGGVGGKAPPGAPPTPKPKPVVEPEPVKEPTPEPTVIDLGKVVSKPETTISVTRRDPHTGAYITTRTTASRFDPSRYSGVITKITGPKGVWEGEIPETEAEYKARLRAEYKETGKVPDWVYGQVEIPSHIKFLEEHHRGPYVTGVTGGPYTRMEKIPLSDIARKIAYEEFLGVESPHPFSAYVGEAYKGLKPKLKSEYGFQFTDWETIPLLERKKYVGAELYFKTHKADLLKEFFGPTGIKELERIEKIPFLSSGVKEEAWMQITLTPEERKQKIYAGYPMPTRIAISSLYAFGGAALWPITLPQLAVKYATGKGDWTDPGGRISTGKPLILPDVAKIYSEFYPGGPGGGIQTLISEGRSRFEGKTELTYEGQMAKEYPVEMAFATFGEVTGLYVGGKALGFGFGKAKLGVTKYGIKPLVRHTPKVVGKIKTITGVSRPVFESEMKLLEGGFKAIGKPQTYLTKTFGITTKVSQTQFWKNISGWSTGELVRVKTLPMISQTFLGKSRTGVQQGPYTLFGRVTKYRGWGKTEWTYPKIAEQFKIGKQFFHVHKFTKTTPGVSERLQIYVTELVGKPKGHLWWKRVTTQTASIREMERLGTRFKLISEPSLGYGSWTRPGHEISKQLTYIGVRPTPKGMANLWKEMEASASLVRPISVARPMMRGVHGTGYLGGYVSIPTTAFKISPTFGMLAGAISRLESSFKQSLASRSELDQIPLPLLKFKQLPSLISKSEKALKPSFESLQGLGLISETSQASVLSLEQAQAQVQLQLQKLASQLEDITLRKLKTKKPRLHPTSFTTPFRGKVPLIPFILPGGELKKKKLLWEDEDIFGKMYRFRKGEIYNPFKNLGFTKRKRKRR